MTAGPAVWHRAITLLHWLEDAFLLLLITAAVTLATTQIVLRNSGADALVWADSALNILVLWIAMAGAMVASRDKDHIAIDILNRYLRGISQRLVQSLSYAATALCCGIAAWYGVRFVQEERQYADIAFLNIPIWLCEAIIPIALGLIAVRYCLYTLQTIFDRQG